MGLDLLQGLHAVGGIQQLIAVLQQFAQNLLVDPLVLHNEDLPLEKQDVCAVIHDKHRLGSLPGVLPCDRAHALKELLFLVHQGICPFKHVMEAYVLSRPEIREAAGDDHLFRVDMLHGAVMERQEQLLPSCQDRYELIAAGPVHRAVLEDIADHLARLDDIFVAGLVTQSIVDHLQAVHITDHHGKFLHRFLLDVRVILPLAQKVGVLAFDASERIGKRRGIGLIPLLQGLPLPLFHGDVICKKHSQSQSEEPGDGQRAEIIRIMEPYPLGVNKLFLIHLEGFLIGRSLHIAENIIDDYVPPLFACPLCPNHGHQDDKGKKGDPDNDGLSEVSGVVLPDDPVEKQQAQQGPGRHERIGLRLNGLVVEIGREQKIHKK